MKGVVFDIQYYAVYDGPGIRTCVFLKGCPLRCAWCHNPESQHAEPQMSYFSERCAHCGMCVEACPSEALRLTKEGVIRNFQSCAACGKCEEVCLNGAMEKIGRRLSPEEISEAVSRDRIFYEASGGGATISGGEPTFQADFLFETIRLIRNRGIHVAIETCGLFKEELLDDLLSLVDLFLYDIKHIDPEMHRSYAGASNEPILSNFEAIVSRAESGRVIPRIPIIPGFNDGADFVAEISGYLNRAGYSGPVHLMPYNRMARTKWEKIGRGSSYRDFGEITNEALNGIIAEFGQRSFEVVCNK